MKETIYRDAVISACGLYRYDLFRSWGKDEKFLLWVMLNPSTADREKDDATIRKCIGFTKRFGYSSLYVVNLFAYRSTRPGELLYVTDPVGWLNDFYLGARAGSPNCAHKIVAAWGSLDFIHKNAAMRARPSQVLSALNAVPRKVCCLGTSKNGDPRHPSRIGYDVELQPFGLPRKDNTA